MHKASSLSELGFDSGGASSGFFRPVADGCPVTRPPPPSRTAASPRSPSSAPATWAWPSRRPSSPRTWPTRSRSSTRSPTSSAARRSTCSTPPPSSRASASSPAPTPPSPRTPTSSSSRPGPGRSPARPGSTCCSGTSPSTARSCRPSPSTPRTRCCSSSPTPSTCSPTSHGGSPASPPAASSAPAYMVGEHGDSSVAIWSSISVGGMPAFKSLRDSHRNFDEAALEGIRRAVVGGAYEVIGLKGYTSWAIGYSVASLAASLLRDQRRVHPVSVLASGFHGISDGHEVFLSLPARLGRGGILGVAEMDLTEAEAAQLRRSAKTLWENCQLLDL
ncbi:hypothetical protein CFC21_086932 [Triticum aestivum]|uniref:L-lactate dehydrogenase n=2 Tax=Triticum aestivum TaxID=4565 RepID=A0A9R1IG35_WHEAT|nr:hypothetical protein CFC21_086932 [Triticum aestivum]